MLPPAALHLADRLATALMALVEAVAHVAKSGSTPALPEAAAQTLFCRLCRLVTRLIRINNFGVPTPTKPKPKPTPKAPEPPAPITPPRRPSQTVSLPRRPGWLLAALPEIAPAVAADLQALLADPATATLLAADPTLYRTLRPLLRSLGLAVAPPTPDSPVPAPDTPQSIATPSNAGRPGAPPPPRTSNPPTRTPTSKFLLPNTTPLHAKIITI